MSGMMRISMEHIHLTQHQNFTRNTSWWQSCMSHAIYRSCLALIESLYEIVSTWRIPITALLGYTLCLHQRILTVRACINTKRLCWRMFIAVWYGVIFVHQGYYSSGAFKFRVAIPEAYPEYPPSVTFISDMFHPLIDSGGNLSLSQQFPTWRPCEDYIFHVLHYIKNIFKKAVLDRLVDKHCPQKEPYRLYRTDIKTFTKLAKQCAELSISESYLYDHFPEDNMIRFSPISESKYGM